MSEPDSSKKLPLADLVILVTEKIDAELVSVDRYVSTDNMISDRGGKKSAEKLPSAKKFNKFEKGDTLFSNIRTYFRKVWQAEYSGGASPDVLIFRSKDPQDLAPDFLFYLISSEEFVNYTVLTAKGAKMPRGDKAAIMDYEFLFPNIVSQRSIAAYLKVLDKKIENNREVNQALEQIAQSIFKSWFIDFEPVKAKQHIRALGGNDEQTERAAQAVIAGAVNLNIITSATDLSALDHQLVEAISEQLAVTASHFPDKLVESELGLIPEGWSVERAAQVAEVAIGKTPPRKEPQWFSMSPSDMKWVSIKDMGNSGMYQIDSSEYLTHEAVDKFNVRKIPGDTVLLSFKLTVGRVAITVGEMVTNEAIAHFKLIDGASVTTEYLYLYLNNFNFDNLGSTSSIATAVNSKMIKEMPILVSSALVVDTFTASVSEVFDAIRLHQVESSSLRDVRDALLPKLLSGDLAVR